MKLRSQRALTERCRPAGRAAGGGAGGTAAPDGSRAAPRDLPVRDGGEGGARSSQQRDGTAVRCERPSARGGKAERCATKAEAGGRARRSSARSDAGSERGKRRRAARGDREAAGVQNEAPCEEAARVRHGQAVAELRAPPAAAGTQCVPAGQRPEPQPGAAADRLQGRPQSAAGGGERTGAGTAPAVLGEEESSGWKTGEETEPGDPGTRDSAADGDVSWPSDKKSFTAVQAPRGTGVFVSRILFLRVVLSCPRKVFGFRSSAFYSTLISGALLASSAARCNPLMNAHCSASSVLLLCWSVCFVKVALVVASFMMWSVGTACTSSLSSEPVFQAALESWFLFRMVISELKCRKTRLCHAFLCGIRVFPAQIEEEAVSEP